MLSTLLKSSALLTFLVGSAVAHPASELAINYAKENFKTALLVPDVIPTFEPTGLFLVNYTESIQAPFQPGAAVSLQNVTQPEDSIDKLIRGTHEGFETAGSPYNNTNAKYTVIFFDAGYPGSPKTDQYNLHYLANDLLYLEGPALHHDSVLIGSNNTARVTYSAPNPPSGSGPHRYVWLVYLQPDDFVAPASPAASSDVNLFNFREYIEASKLGNPFAGNFYTVEVGSRASSVSVAQTAAVVSTTLAGYTAPSSAAPSASGSSAASSSAFRTIDNLGLKSQNLLFAAVAVVLGAAFALV
ncbi:hypothetical protein FRC03_003932 [Tulasnella sp. 419]|nr:hypothetical protein FRC03_003932 [Tulasnella sp. 419]